MLKQLFDKHVCDKSSKHKYHTVYDQLFSPIKDDPIKFLEIGVFKGASTAAFHEYFQNGTIYGLDIFVRTNPSELAILNEDRVKWLKGDSTSPTVAAQIHEWWDDVKFDVILDDGMHTPAANMATFQNLLPFLKQGGMYIIEDVWPLELMSTMELQHPWLTKNPDRYTDLENMKFLDAMSKSGLSIERFDLRGETGEPDSYIIKMS